MHVSRRLLPLLAVLLAALPVHAQTGGALRVVRSTPSDDAPPRTPISVTFDRPVAGSLDRTIDPARLLRVTPAVPGRIEWRDAVTLRLIPSAPLVPGQRYTVTVSNDFRAMDGSALAAPHQFSFRARGPTLLGGTPLSPDTRHVGHLRPAQRFQLVYSAPVDLAQLGAAAYIELYPGCAGPRIVRLTAVSQRRTDATRDAGDEEGPRPRAADSLGRIVTLVPTTPLPRSCSGELVAPTDLADATRPAQRMSFSTYGDFKADNLSCATGTVSCPTGSLVVSFTNPVRGADVLRRVKIYPETKFIVRDTSEESTSWTLEGKLRPRTSYAVVVDTALRDVFGQRLTGNPALGLRTTGFSPAVNYPFGTLLVERVGFRTLAVQHVNVDTLVATVVTVPREVEARLLSRYARDNDSLWNSLQPRAAVQRLPVRAAVDRPMITGVRLPAQNAMSAGAATLLAVRVTGRTAGVGSATEAPTALIQMTDLGVHARVGTSDAAVWVTGVSDGRARPDAVVELHDATGRVLATARTNAEGIARMSNWVVAPADTAHEENDWRRRGFEGYVSVQLGPDRAVTAINEYDPDLSPWRFNVSSAYGDERFAISGAAFTERGIYRPGERVYAKAIVRTGAMGALRAPAAGDSIRWRFHDRDEGMLREVTTALSAFGTADQVVTLPANAPVGEYSLDIGMKRQGKWRTVAGASYRVAEYRPPEFLVDMPEDTTPKLVGDKLTAHVSARYLFGAPMGRAAVSWSARRTTVWPWELNIPGTDDWNVGESGSWWEEYSEEQVDEFASEPDTLDARGEHAWSVQAPAALKGRASRVTIEATVTDVNRQTVSARTTRMVHPADLYVAARPVGRDYFWKAGIAQTIEVMAVRPDGRRVAGTAVKGTIVRREWHRVRRERDGVSELVGEWVADTLGRCDVTTAATPVSCAFTPTAGGIYTVSLSATDARGRVATTSFQRWTSGDGWVPWSDETQFRMDVIPNRTRYAVGDTATVMFASPFTNAEAWITIEREGVIQQRRLRITSGSTTIKLPVTEAFAPNVFVSIVVARGRSAPPGTLDDAGRPTIRVGYAELRVTPEVKRLAVTVSAAQPEYRPGDTARVRVHVQDRQRRGVRSEVTLWAVDEGVLSLTGYRTPDPVSLIYRPRGLGLRLASNMTSVAPQIPEGEKGRREAGGGGGAMGSEILRSRFQTTAFFLGSVVTDASGNAVVSAKLPDNITTFRLMAVAVTAGDRYGSGQSPMLVTRPLLARQALPRFVRPGDEFTAGAVVNRRDGAPADVTVTASATGIALRGGAEQHVTLSAMRGSEVRFPFQASHGDSATFRFDVRDDRNADAVRVTIPTRPDHHPVARTLAGVLRDTATLELALPAGIDTDRSRVTVNVGVSPLAAIKGMAQTLKVYPYYCSEQVISAAVPIIALYRAERNGAKGLLAGDPRAEMTRAVQMLSSRQRGDGGIGYWSSTDWTSPWLSAYAGMVLLDARDQGIPVDTLVLSRLAGYLTTAARDGESAGGFTPIGRWYETRDGRLSDRVAVVDLMSRFGRPLIEAENELLRGAAQLSLEDRARLAEVLARRGQLAPARTLMQSVWPAVRVVGRRAELTDTTRRSFYFESRMRPLARVLTATLAVAPDHALIGPLAEGLAVQGSHRGGWFWNTQDYASAVTALAELDRRRRAQGDRALTVRAGERAVLQWSAGAASTRDSTLSLRALLGGRDAGQPLQLSLRAGPGEGVLYYYVTLTEIPLAPPVTVLDNGIQVERWYENVTTGKPVSAAAEGELVRVRLRLTVPATRYFVVLDDALPAGLEAVDLSLRTAVTAPGPGKGERDASESEDEAGGDEEGGWYGRWDSGWWTPFEHSEIRDDRVVYSATTLWQGSYTASYIARATTPGTFIRPPAHAEEMYDPAVNGRSDGGTFIVTAKKK